MAGTNAATKDREDIKGTTKQKIARRHDKKGGNHLEQESIRQKTMEGIDGGLHPAAEGHSLGERRFLSAGNKDNINTTTSLTSNHHHWYHHSTLTFATDTVYHGMVELQRFTIYDKKRTRE